MRVRIGGHFLLLEAVSRCDVPLRESFRGAFRSPVD
jgi:hypothetical protein